MGGGGGGTAPLTLNLDTRGRRVQSIALSPQLYRHRRDSVTRDDDSHDSGEESLWALVGFSGPARGAITTPAGYFLQSISNYVLLTHTKTKAGHARCMQGPCMWAYMYTEKTLGGCDNTVLHTR